MAQATLDKVLEEIETLDSQELFEVNRTVQRLLEPIQQEKEARRDALLQILLTAGVTREVKRPDFAGYPEPSAVAIEGKPVSETIIEERR